jgi:hypothetical protein
LITIRQLEFVTSPKMLKTKNTCLFICLKSGPGIYILETPFDDVPLDLFLTAAVAHIDQ